MTGIADISETQGAHHSARGRGAGGNAVNNMIDAGLEGVEFVVANTDAQALAMSKATHLIQMGRQVTEGLGAGAQPELGAPRRRGNRDDPRSSGRRAHGVHYGRHGRRYRHGGSAYHRQNRARNLAFSPSASSPNHSISRASAACALPKRESPKLPQVVDTLLIIPNQNLFRVAHEKTTFVDAFAMADQVLYSGVACISDLIVKEGLINLDFADVLSVMREKGKAMMGEGRGFRRKARA